jgi:hypothetical protein
MSPRTALIAETTARGLYLDIPVRGFVAGAGFLNGGTVFKGDLVIVFDAGGSDGGAGRHGAEAALTRHLRTA